MEIDTEKPKPNNATSTDLTTGQVVANLPCTTPMKRKFSILNIISVGYNISNSWVAIATSFAIAIQSGGAVSLLYGIITVAATMACTGITLAELASVYPTAGGQYHFTSILASQRWSRGLSYACGLAAVFSWVTLAASIALAATQALMAMVVYWQPGYQAQNWHLFLVYQLLNAVMVLYNIVLTNRTLWVYNLGFMLSLSTFLAITITCPILSPDTSQINTPAVWTQMTNGSNGWPDAIAYLTGLSTPQFMLSGLDASLHLAEECLEAERIVPRAVMVTVLIGFLTAFPFAVSAVYSCTDVAETLDSKTGFPIYTIWTQATNSPIAGTIFMASLFTISCVAINAVHQTASRMTWSFARDDALFGSRWLGVVHEELNVPIYALVVNGVVVLLVGIVYVCSSTAFNAFISTTVIVGQISFSIPAFLLLLRRRSSHYLPPKRPFRVPDVIGYLANIICVAWAVVVTVFFTFPTSFPVTGGNMTVLGVMLILGIGNWFAHARSYYHGPRLE